MRIDTAQPIIGWDWDPVENGRVPGGPPSFVLTVRWAIQLICNTHVSAAPYTPETIITCGTLAKRAFEPNPEYSDKDRAFLLDRSEKMVAEKLQTVIVHQFLADIFDSSNALAAVHDISGEEANDG